MLNPANLLALRTEILNDPLALGLTALWTNGQYGLLRDALNAQTVVATKADRTIGAAEFVAAIVWTEFSAMSQPARDYLAMLSRTTFIYTAEVKAALLAIFTASGAGTSRQNLAQIINRNSSRAEVLFGQGTIISIEDLAAARP